MDIKNSMASTSKLAVDAHFKAGHDYPLHMPGILQDGYYNEDNNREAIIQGCDFKMIWD